MILFLSFLALASSPGTDIKVFATALGIGILLDATIVRALLVPALVSLFGRWNWWLPAWAAKPMHGAAARGDPGAAARGRAAAGRRRRLTAARAATHARPSAPPSSAPGTRSAGVVPRQHELGGTGHGEGDQRDRDQEQLDRGDRAPAAAERRATATAAVPCAMCPLGKQYSDAVRRAAISGGRSRRTSCLTSRVTAAAPSGAATSSSAGAASPGEQQRDRAGGAEQDDRQQVGRVGHRLPSPRRRSSGSPSHRAQQRRPRPAAGRRRAPPRRARRLPRPGPRRPGAAAARATTASVLGHQVLLEERALLRADPARPGGGEVVRHEHRGGRREHLVSSRTS